MVKLKYIGSLRIGNVEGIGTVEYGKTYNISEKLSKRLLNTRHWIKVKEEKAKCPVCNGTNMHYKDGCLDCKKEKEKVKKKTNVIEE
jgi:hypothetical protein